MTVRLAQTRDIPRIHALLRQVEEVHHRIRPDLFRDGGSKYTDGELAAILADGSRPILAAVDGDDRLVGYAFCILQQQKGSTVMTDVKTLYIDDLCVDEAQRGRHVGNALYRHVLGFAKESGCYNLTLNVWACNEAAKGFYEHCGLKPQKIGMETIL